MTDIKPMISNDNASLSVPIHHSKNRIISNAHLPPTPSMSSSVSSYISQTTKARDLSLKIPNVQQQRYGSLGSSTPYLESLSTIEGPLTPSHTTISPNEDDEGLYLLWTQQLLREKGFTPSPCRPEFEDYMEKESSNNKKTGSSSNSLEDDASDNEDDDGDDSSVSDMSFSSDDDMDEDDDNDRYIAEQRKLLLNSPAPSAFRSHQPSLISRYSTNNYAADEVAEDDTTTGLDDAPSQSSIYSMFKQFFSACF
ncbi:hypothetical protein V8B55DRAFT_1373922 [Mucor lusitanicus]|uniref:Uncharacterized protein n=1 Tax=Mucor lusitanicus CBS 277.49 TaxID=747725 RepID=A0A168JUD2_MUCCL|nr:hypothetical protein MUCCIDRAFT_83370 [Mucor lusitanicus CBS 277.49]